MKSEEIPRARLLRQRIAGEGLGSPADVVRWMGAVQAQDYAAAKWAVALRTQSCTDADLEAAFTRGEILRSHVMRPTWHFVAPEDIGWMQALTGPRVESALAYNDRHLELDAAVLRKSISALEKALRGGRQLTRSELGAALERAGVEAEGLRLAHIVMHAELRGLLCSGGRRGKQFTYALVEERASTARALSHDESLALLTERYFASHGPATLKDFGWWSGLPITEMHAGLEMAKSRLMNAEISGRTYWMSPEPPAGRLRGDAAFLLGNYDEYIVGYTDRAEIFDNEHVERLGTRQNPLFEYVLLLGGQIAGTWKRSTKVAAEVQVKPFSEPSRAAKRAIAQAIKRYRAYVAGQ